MKLFAALSLLLAGTACTPMAWVKPDTAPEQMAADARECRQEAWREASWRSLGAFYYGPYPFYDPFGRRLGPWPHYGPFGDPFGDRFMEEARLADFCMRAKGYSLEALKR